MIAFIGVRISWLIAARNALLAWFAPSAAAVASWARRIGGRSRGRRRLPGQPGQEVEVRLAERRAVRAPDRRMPIPVAGDSGAAMSRSIEL